MISNSPGIAKAPQKHSPDMPRDVSLSGFLGMSKASMYAFCSATDQSKHGATHTRFVFRVIPVFLLVSPTLTAATCPMRRVLSCSRQPVTSILLPPPLVIVATHRSFSLL